MDFYFIAGVVISILLTYWGIWHASKSSKKIELALIDINQLSLLTTFEDNLKTIKIENYQLPINTSLYYYQGAFMNTGTVDIDRSKMYQPLKFSLPEGSKIVEFKIDKKNSVQIGLKTTNSNSELSFEWDLLKSLEQFSFELIYETAQYDKKIKLQLSHRITDLKEIKRIDKSDLKLIMEKKRWDTVL